MQSVTAAFGVAAGVVFAVVGIGNRSLLEKVGRSALLGIVTSGVVDAKFIAVLIKPTSPLPRSLIGKPQLYMKLYYTA